MNRAKIQDYIDQRTEERRGLVHVVMKDEPYFSVNNHEYELLVNYRNAFDPDQLANRYSNILSKYDYIVGDWGYDQLRLRGFYAHHNPAYDKDHSVDTIQDYLDESCNFGCAYFVIQNLDVKVQHKRRRRRSRRPRHNNKPYREQRDQLKQPNVKRRHHQAVQKVHHGRRRSFVMRKKDQDKQ